MADEFNPNPTPVQEEAAVKPSMGVEENVGGLLCYLASWITGLIFFFGEKNSKFIKFHALQSIILGVFYIVIYIALSIIDSVLWFAAPYFLWKLFSVLITLVSLAFLGVTILMMVKAYQKVKFKLPIIGDIAEKNSAK